MAKTAVGTPVVEPAAFPDDRRPVRRRLRWLMLAALVALVAAGFQQLVRSVVAETTLPTGRAEWIWGVGRHRQVAPAALWAVRDFTLDAVPVSVHLLVTADESHVVYLNGRRVGSDVYRQGAPLDRYPVTASLRPGANRLAVELRSVRGAGGLLLALVDDAAGDPILVTDRRWRIFDHDHPGILEGWLPLDRGEPPISWGTPPVGRWGSPREVIDRPSFTEIAGEPWQISTVPPVRVTTGAAVLAALGSALIPEPTREPGAGSGPVSDRSPEGLRWQPVELSARDSPAARRGLGPVALFDWQREVTGYLTLARGGGGGAAAGIVRLGSDLPRVELSNPDASVVTVPGGGLWHDALPRRFRYALVLGVGSIEGAWVESVAPGDLERLPAPPAPVTGLFGLQPPPLRTPVEDEVGRQLQGLARRAGREDL